MRAESSRANALVFSQNRKMRVNTKKTRKYPNSTGTRSLQKYSQLHVVLSPPRFSNCIVPRKVVFVKKKVAKKQELFGAQNGLSKAFRVMEVEIHLLRIPPERSRNRDGVNFSRINELPEGYKSKISAPLLRRDFAKEETKLLFRVCDRPFANDKYCNKIYDGISGLVFLRLTNNNPNARVATVAGSGII